MKMKTCRLKAKSLIIIALTANIFLFACDDFEKPNHANPTISYIIDPDFVSSDSTISVGQSFKIGIQAEFNGYNKLTNFIAFLNGERYLDLGIYAETYHREIEITKGLEDVDLWKFMIRDMEGNYATTSLTIYKNPDIIYGEIHEYLNVRLGAQKSSEFGSFFSTNNGTQYSLESAYNNQAMIDMVYYYDDFDKLEENIIASPGANLISVFPGAFDVTNWEIKNTIRYSREKLSVTTDDFDIAMNDSILIASSFAFESGGRKTKYLKAGDIYSFVKDDNRAGMFKVISTSGTTSGNIIIDIKIQK